MKKPTDDYYWPDYTQIYSKQTADMVSENTQFIIKNSYIENNKVVFKDNFHENWKELYKQAIERNVSEVFECGCGPGHHLYNIKKLNSSIQTFGIELLQTQVDFGKNTLNIPENFYETIEIIDFSVPCASCLFNFKYEFVYTQAVTMHLNYEKALTFLRNMANISSKYIFLIENWQNHDYPTLLKESGILNVFSYEFIQGEYQKYLLLTK
jgi:SAM-dependent methyltransferase